jgi:hypothetical protein
LGNFLGAIQVLVICSGRIEMESQELRSFLSFLEDGRTGLGDSSGSGHNSWRGSGDIGVRFRDSSDVRLGGRGFLELRFEYVLE